MSDAIREAIQNVKSAIAHNTGYEPSISLLQRSLDELESALQSGEPVGHALACGDPEVTIATFNADRVSVGTKLYTAPQPVVSEGYVLVPRAAATEVLRISDRQHPAWEEVRTALLSAGKEKTK
jgi:hypothetical protein